MYDIQESGDFDITIDGRHCGSVRRNRTTGRYGVCILLDGEPPVSAPAGMQFSAHSPVSMSWQTVADVLRDDALGLAHVACQLLADARNAAADTATDAGHVPYMLARTA